MLNCFSPHFWFHNETQIEFKEHGAWRTWLAYSHLLEETGVSDGRTLALRGCLPFVLHNVTWDIIAIVLNPLKNIYVTVHNGRKITVMK